MNETVENGGTEAESVTGKRTESAGGPDLVNAVDAHVPVIERGRETDRLEMTAVEVVDVERERRTGGEQQGEIAGVGRGAGKEREGVEARIVRRTGKESREWMEMRSVREMGHLRVVNGCLRNMREKLLRGLRSVETGRETGTRTVDAATGTGTGVGETVKEIGNTRETEGRETEGTEERSVIAPYET